MATTPYTGYTSSDKPATVTTTPAPIIDATKVGTTAPITLPTPSPYDVGNYTSAINTTAGSIEAQTNAALAEQQAQQKLAQAQAGSNDIATLQAQMGGKAADTATAYQTGGVNTAYNQLQDLNAQAMGLKNEASAIPIANRLQAQTLGTVGTENQVQNVNYDQLQRNALKALSLGQQAAIAESNYNKAKNLADQQVEIKYGQMEADLKAKQTQLDALNKYQLTPAQEKAKTALERQYKLQDQELADKKAQEKELNAMFVNASSQGAPVDLVTKAQKAKTPMEAAKILGQYAGDYWGTKYKIAQINKLNADAAETNAKVLAAGGVGTKSQANTQDQAKFLLNTINEAVNLSSASGRSKARRGAESYIVGATDYTNLESKVRTLKTNLLTLATDPNVKKFFGPQMTEADVRNMQAAATTLDTESQSPAELKAELERAQKIFQKFAPGYVPPVEKKQTASTWATSIKGVILNPSQGGNYGYQDNTQ